MSARSAAKAGAGETRAAEHLEAAGFEILARNYRSRVGEIDLVARHRDQLVFVEVKTWDVFGRAELERSIGPAKQERIVRTSRVFLMEHPEFADSIVRYDVVFLSDELRRVEHIEAAF